MEPLDLSVGRLEYDFEPLDLNDKPLDRDLLKLRDVFELERPDERDLRAAVQTSA